MMASVSPSTPLPPAAKPEDPFSQSYIPPTHRISLSPTTRLTMASIGSFLIGSGLGATHGAKMAGLRFRAEHAHKLPSDTTGWYLYHKSKNYSAMVGGFREGLKMGVKTSFWTTATLSIESLFDTSRGTADMFNTVLAGLTVAGGFSLWNRFTIPEAGRVARVALLVSIAWGGLQDVAGVARGRRIGYVEFVRRHIPTRSKTDKTKDPQA